MENMNPALFNPYTILNDRILWFDGDSSYTVKALADKIVSGSITWVNEFIIDPDDFSVKRINELDSDITLKHKESLHIEDDSFDWNIPEEYLNFDIEKLIINLLKEELSAYDFSIEEKKQRIIRVKEEFLLWEKNNLLNVLKLLSFIISKFNENNIIWGTGRGSSCCSYILYLIGVHDVDSVHYELDITDFFRA